jgi:diguanylate cyclase (GGDEF)-like protein
MKVVLHNNRVTPRSDSRDGSPARLSQMLTALRAANRVVLDAQSPNKLYQQICRAAMCTGNLVGAAIFLREPGTDLLKAVAGTGEEIERLLPAAISIAEPASPGEGPVPTAFRARKPCIVNDLASDAPTAVWQEEAGRVGVRAAAALPVTRGSSCVGVLVAYLDRHGALDEQLVCFLASMADSLALALDNRTREVERERAQRAEHRLARMFAALSSINHTILCTRAEADLYPQVCEAAFQSGDFSGTAIMMLEPETRDLQAVASSGEALAFLRDVRIALDAPDDDHHGIAGRAFLTRKPIIATDVSQDQHLRGRQKVGSAAALPLMRAGRSIGVLIVGVTQSHALDQGSVALLTRMAENVAFALDNFDREAESQKTERAARRAARMFAALSATNEAILRARTPNELYQGVCDAAVHGGKSLASTVLLAEPNSPWLKPVAGTGAIVEMVKQTRFSIDADDPYGQGVCGQAFRTQKPCVNRDILHSEQAKPWLHHGRQFGVVACAALPLTRGGRSIGVLMVFINKWWAIDEEIIALLARMAENVSVALECFEQEANRKNAEERARYLATHDDLTGLPNRVMFSQTLNESIKLARRHNQLFSVMFIDLDRFKIINDTLGHAAGDILLKEAAARLRQCLRESDVVARLGGDEFMVLVRDTDDIQQADIVARKILATLLKPMVIHGHECRVTASIGISVFPTHGEDEDTLTRTADLAMYLAKEEGRSAFRFYSPAIKTQSIEHLMLETSLRRALERDEFLLHYQAKQDLNTGLVSGVEALLRWQHPDLGLLLPGRFIGLAEETGLIVAIGKWALETACAQNVAWQKQGFPRLRMAVNLSPRQFADEQLLSSIQAILERSGMAPELLELEITESMVLQNVERALRLLRAIKKIGVRLAIDDFGTGYSSMSLIKQFPIDTLKVDRSFVRDIDHDADDRAITEAIIALGKALDLNIVAEGVETKTQEKFLRAHACDEIQGYLFSKPVASEQFVAFMAEMHAAQAQACSSQARQLPDNSGTTRRRRDN